MSRNDTRLVALYERKPTVFRGWVDKTVIFNDVVGEVRESSDMAKEGQPGTSIWRDISMQHTLNDGFADS
jgi:hypothetical protein